LNRQDASWETFYLLLIVVSEICASVSRSTQA
jgi:hypothetical protein